MPLSMARSMIRCESGSSVSGPKFMVPSTRRDTRKPVRPRWVYSILRPYARGEEPPVAAWLKARWVLLAALGVALVAGLAVWLSDGSATAPLSPGAAHPSAD